MQNNNLEKAEWVKCKCWDRLEGDGTKVYRTHLDLFIERIIALIAAYYKYDIYTVKRLFKKHNKEFYYILKQTWKHHNWIEKDGGVIHDFKELLKVPADVPTLK